MQKATQFDVLGYSAFKEMIVYALNLKSDLGGKKNNKKLNGVFKRKIR